jgi:DNA-binding LytR/AlgR family response regulator
MGEGVPPVRVVIADDHPIVRAGLRALLDAEPDLEVVGEAVDTSSAERYVRGHKPDVLVMDLTMPGEFGVDAIPRLRGAAPNTNIVVHTMRSEPACAAGNPGRSRRLRPQAVNPHRAGARGAARGAGGSGI